MTTTIPRGKRKWERGQLEARELRFAVNAGSQAKSTEAHACGRSCVVTAQDTKQPAVNLASHHLDARVTPAPHAKIVQGLS